ncbi:MAG: IS66 family insertion sequence element accessory protein TnpB [Planctomycetota bacterium]|nr:IS66 family insertion sequence element accessory protein TnpB [Planctomycetota bacterium]
MKHDTAGAGHRAHCDLSREEYWRSVLRDFAGSGQSVRAFCASRGLSEPSFYSWRRTLAERDARSPAVATPVQTPAFVPIHVAEENGERIEIVLRGDRRVRLCGPVDRAALAEIVAALEGLPSRLESVR